MKAERLAEIIGSDFYIGVPDSQLKALCDYLMNVYGMDPRHHMIAANEGNCTAIAAGYYLATGKIPVVYMQNSGEGNMINPAASLLNDKVYGIPVIFIVGWRGEPGIYDEPQHIYQGKVTVKLLEDMDIATFVIGKETGEQEVSEKMEAFRGILASGKSVAFVIGKGAISYDEKVDYRNDNVMVREEVIRHILDASGEDPVICTTGKASRELFEVRVENGQPHKFDFLTVGSMGHSSSIALGIAMHKRNQRIWCIDGDGAALMHMGAMAVIGASKPDNLIHIVINDESHETDGGMPTAAKGMDLAAIAKACRYPYTVIVTSYEELDKELEAVKADCQLSFIEVKCSVGARDNPGRPTTTTLDNKADFMSYLKELEIEE